MTAAMTEKEFQAAVVEAAQWCGWTVHHQLNSRGSQPGWPDLVLIPKKAMGQTAFVELKTDKGRLSAAQRSTLKGLRQSGLSRVWVWRPAQLAEILAWIRAVPTKHESEFEAVTLGELYTFANSS